MKTLMPITPVKVPTTQLIFLFIVIPLIVRELNSGGYNSYPNVAMFAALFFVTLFYVMFLGILLKSSAAKRINNKIRVEAKEKFSEFVGGNPKYLNVDFALLDTGNTGTGIAYRDGHVYMMEAGEAIKIPWKDVRSWSWEIPGFSEVKVYSGNTEARLNARQANMEARADARSKSGFFVDIANIDHPTWHFNTDDETVLKRWYEIFTQLKENNGSLPEAAS